LSGEIAFNVPEYSGAEIEHVRRSLASGHTSANHEFSQKAREILQAETGAAEVLLTTSCTAALELSAMLLDLQPGDTVIVPSFTFTSTALAFVREGARILFCDIEPRTLGPDPRSVAALLDDSVRAVVVVHYAGIACDMAGLRRQDVRPSRSAGVRVAAGERGEQRWKAGVLAGHRIGPELEQRADECTRAVVAGVLEAGTDGERHRAVRNDGGILDRGPQRLQVARPKGGVDLPEPFLLGPPHAPDHRDALTARLPAA
jgi:hypothetical protein